jgi:4-amino-4-deoxy-L-arabinose transferase-like glycosyltransferase
MQTSYLVFGQNNFAARLPGVVSAVGIGVTLGIGVLSLLGWEAALVAIAVFASSCMTFFLSGAALLDVTLTLGTTITLVGLLLVERTKIAGYLVFVGLALGVMTKGPLACILVGCVVVPWAIGHRILAKRWPPHLAQLPWVAGTVLFLVLVIPWYIWAEIRNPGFLEYFLWNENFGRYLKKDYVDEYGSGHRQPFGAAIFMMLLALFPWSFLLLGLLVPRVKRILSKQIFATLAADSLLLFALCWSVSCSALLLGATQYTATYLMPSVPGFALLAGVLWNRYRAQALIRDLFLRKALILATGFILAVWVVISVISLWFTPNLIVTGASLGLALWISVAVLRFISSSRNSDQNLGILVLLSLVSTLAYGAATLCLNNYLSVNRSSRQVLATVQTLNPSGTPLRVGFPFYFPFSAWFYAPQVLSPGSSLVEFEGGDLSAAAADVFVVRKRNLDRFKKELPDAHEIGAAGQWRIMKR